MGYIDGIKGTSARRARTAATVPGLDHPDKPLHHVAPITCPCCHGAGAIEPDAPVELSPTQLLIWDTVRRAPAGLTAPQIAARIYALRADGGPEYAKGCIYATIRAANRRLQVVGIAITCGTRTRGGVYRIQQIDGGAS